MTSTSTERITSPWVMGVVAAVRALAIAVAVCVVPALAAQVAARHSALTVLDAVLLGIDTLVLGHGGSLVLTGGPVPGGISLAPLGLMLLFVLVCAASMRRMGRAQSLVDADGSLRAGALRDAGIALGAFAVAYAIGGGFLAAIGRSPLVHPAVSTALVTCALVALVGGLLGLVRSLRVPGSPRQRAMDLLPAPWDAVARAAGIALGLMLAASLVLVVVMLGLGLQRAGAVMDRLDPGIVGGIVLTLLQLALLPTFALWALAVMVGGTITVGTGTAISLGSATSGVLPALPMLAALPQPGTAPGWTWLLLAVPVAATALGAVHLARSTAELPLRTRWGAGAGYAAVVVVAVMLALGLSIAGIGTGRLRTLGPELATVVLPLLGLVVGTTAIVWLIACTPLLAWARDAATGLRGRVERAERRERGDADPVAPAESETHAEGDAHADPEAQADPETPPADSDAPDEASAVSPPADR